MFLFKKKPPVFIPNKIDRKWTPEFKQAVKNANSMKTDLLEMSKRGVTCGECSKYEGRVFSISGTSKRFPPLPECIKERGEVHEGCRHSFYPFKEGVSKPMYAKNIVAYSNAPFVDQRTPEQKLQYDEEQTKLLAKVESERQYDILKKRAPDLAPKTLAAFSRMRNANSKGYQSIVQQCADRKIKLQ